MTRPMLLSAILVLGLATLAFGQSSAPPTKIGVINLRAAMENTQEGQKAGSELQRRYDPVRKDLEKKQNEIQSLRDQLSRGSNTMSDEAKNTLARDIDTKTKQWNRDQEDAATDFQADLDRIQQGLFEKMQVVIDKYARDNAYAVILDISSEQSPVVYISNTIDVTNDIIALYDKNAPVAAAKPAAAKPASAPASTPVVPARPPAAAPAK
ncbi:MAG: OmpH family outer membrane protein [Bryobacterales bacterium]|nr:OmpH family outer membrane protein [Bryobacterales bacterium]